MKRKKIKGLPSNQQHVYQNALRSGTAGNQIFRPQFSALDKHFAHTFVVNLKSCKFDAYLSEKSVLESLKTKEKFFD